MYEVFNNVPLKVTPRVTNPYPICICSKEFITDFYTLGGMESLRKHGEKMF